MTLVHVPGRSLGDITEVHDYHVQPARYGVLSVQYSSDGNVVVIGYSDGTNEVSYFFVMLLLTYMYTCDYSLHGIGIYGNKEIPSNYGGVNQLVWRIITSSSRSSD